jgi:5-methylcytosine-specific restriction endonuclease McrA
MPFKDPEKRREYYRKQRAANPEKFREAKRKWRAENPEQNREHDRKWKATHPEQHREKLRLWRLANPLKILESLRRWNDNNREKKRESNNKWRIAHPEVFREKELRRRAAKRGAVISKVDLEFIWNRDNGVCYLCNQPIDPDDCHYDHVIPLAKGGEHSTDNLRPTHSKCNLKKHAKLM